MDADVSFHVRSSKDPNSTLQNFLTGQGINRVFFTDGSLSRSSGDDEAAVGFAIVSDDPELVHCERIGGWNTIFDAESRGVFDLRSAAVVTDSLSVVKCLESPDPRGTHPDIVYQIKELVQKMERKGQSVKFV